MSADFGGRGGRGAVRTLGGEVQSASAGQREIPPLRGPMPGRPASTRSLPTRIARACSLKTAHRRHLRRRHPDPHPRAAPRRQARRAAGHRGLRGRPRVVPLLGGHRGANDLARALAAALGSVAAITTAGDNRFGVALDAPPAGWTLANPDDAKPVMARSSRGAVRRASRRRRSLAESEPHAVRGRRSGRLARHHRATAGRRIDAGLPSARPGARHRLRAGAPAGSADRARPPDARRARACAAQPSRCVASIDLKADEPAVLEVAAELGVPARFFPADGLKQETPRLRTRRRRCSARSAATAWRKAQRSPPPDRKAAPRREAEERARHLRHRRGPARLDPTRVGRPRAASPSSASARAAPMADAEARRLLEASDAGRLRALSRSGRRRSPSARSASIPARRGGGALPQRPRRWRPKAARSRSSPPAMPASTRWPRWSSNCLDAAPDPAWARFEIIGRPGVSAMQAAAARAGAPLGHDFCAISLSDLLTPVRRSRGASARPRRRLRHRLLQPRLGAPAQAARGAATILLEHRPPRHPVVLARNLGREGETSALITLGELDADMSTC